MDLSLCDPDEVERIWMPAIHETQEIIIASDLMVRLTVSKNVLIY